MPRPQIILEGRGGVEQLAADGSSFIYNMEWGSERIYFSGENTYKAWAEAGADENDPVWRILRININSVSGNVTKLWADGNTEFDNIFANRESLTYL